MLSNAISDYFEMGSRQKEMKKGFVLEIEEDTPPTTQRQTHTDQIKDKDNNTEQIRDKYKWKKGTKKEKKARGGKIESTEVIDGEWQARL